MSRVNMICELCKYTHRIRLLPIFFTLLWNCWNSRNIFIFNGKEDDARGVWERAKNLSQDFRIHNLVYMPVIPAASIRKTWIKPPKGFIKINFVAALSNTMMGFGVIARDEDGFAIGGSGGYKDCSLQAEWAEMVAFKESVKVAIRLKMSNILFESDCANLVNKINNRGKDFTILGSHIKVVCTQLDNFESVNVVWSHRSSNTVTDFICNLAIQNKCNRCFGMNYVEDIHQRVVFDAIN
ncbi:hypothetical protein Gotri_012603 [Gossypium trilobum]|uniref:RNase H type-1 domain-containing protein n=1 Tax=Gossypium trilobum TaxID=34281 RepID=A0A7J9DQT7_9ROSI|nr:hypothetical protein [Gossypium trilobum]